MEGVAPVARPDGGLDPGDIVAGPGQPGGQGPPDVTGPEDTDIDTRHVCNVKGRARVGNGVLILRFERYPNGWIQTGKARCATP